MLLIQLQLMKYEYRRKRILKSIELFVCLFLQRTFTRKDGTYIDRENILMALSDLDTLLVQINPIGGRKNAV